MPKRGRSLSATTHAMTHACMDISSFPDSTALTLFASQSFSNSAVCALSAARSSLFLFNSSGPSSTTGGGGAPGAKDELPLDGAGWSFFKIASFARLRLAQPRHARRRRGEQRAHSFVGLPLSFDHWPRIPIETEEVTRGKAAELWNEETESYAAWRNGAETIVSPVILFWGSLPFSTQLHLKTAQSRFPATATLEKRKTVLKIKIFGANFRPVMKTPNFPHFRGKRSCERVERGRRMRRQVLGKLFSALRGNIFF